MLKVLIMAEMVCNIRCRLPGGCVAEFNIESEHLPKAMDDPSRRKLIINSVWLNQSDTPIIEDERNNLDPVEYKVPNTFVLEEILNVTTSSFKVHLIFWSCFV